MRDDLFEELLESVCEGGAILRGERDARRAFEVPASDKRVKKSSLPPTDSQREYPKHTPLTS